MAGDPHLGDRAKVVAAVIAYATNWKTDYCYPSMATLARLVGGQERGTRNAVRELEAAGWLVCRGTKGRVTNVYAPDFAASADYQPFQEATQHDGAGITQHDDAGSEQMNPARNSLQPGTEQPPTRHDGAAKQENKINNASGSAPLGAHATAEKRKPTPEEIAARSAEFDRKLAGVRSRERQEKEERA